MSSWKVVSLERPREGVALVTMSNPEIRNHVSWAGVGELAQALAEAREGGARIVVLASGVPGHWLEHAWLTDLLKAASLHLNAYQMNSLYLEYNVSSASLLSRICREPIRMKDGMIPVPEGPGLGVEVDEDLVEKHRVL